MHQAIRMRLQDRSLHLGGRWGSAGAGQQHSGLRAERPRQSMGVYFILLPHPKLHPVRLLNSA